MKGFKTLTFNAVATIVPFLGMAEVIEIIPPEYMAHYIVVMALGNAVLRWMTDSPIGRQVKAPDA